METKKLSFGFSKVIKKNILLPKPNLNNDYHEGKKIELIKCIEESSIKLIKDTIETQPLVIPMKNSTKTSAAVASLNARKAVLEGIEQDSVINKDNEQSNPEHTVGESLDARAARELLQEVQKQQNIEVIDTNLVLPINDTKVAGAKESNLDDYESIPVQQFGLAMLRGMGWKDDPNLKKKSIDLDGPVQRPKGMGLGADKAIKNLPLLVQPEENEKLEIKKSAYIRILAGKHKNFYGQIEGLDDHAGRVIIKLVIGGEKVSLNEFLVQPVSKREFQKHGKIINSTKYENYKKFENDQGQIVLPKNYDTSQSSSSKIVIKQEYESRSEKTKSRLSRSPYKKYNKDETNYNFYKLNSKHDSSKDRYRGESSDDSVHDRCSSESSESRHHHKAKKTKKKSKKIKKYYRNVSSEDEKKHKKKTKKSKRERSRSRSRSRTRR